VSVIQKEGAMMTEKTLRVPGMHCGHCKAAVEGELRKLSGVEDSNADFEKGIVEVRYDEDQVTPEELREAIEEAGYNVTV
jgi:copper chaperone